MENINEIKSGQKKLFDLLEEQKEIKEIITKIIDTIVLQKKIVKFNSNKSLIMNCGFKIYENDQIKIKIGCKYWKLKILLNIWGY